MNVVRPARTSVLTVVFFSRSLKKRSKKPRFACVCISEFLPFTQNKSFHHSCDGIPYKNTKKRTHVNFLLVYTNK